MAEIASTTNENLLTSYLLDHYDDPQLKLFVINHYLDGFKGTVFRQTQFAEFEHYIHQQAQAGEALTSDFMDAKYAELNRFYYGPGLTPDPEIAWEWARIPHFYYNYYVYQYATGFSAASSFAQRILSGDQAEVDRYLNFLRAGSSDYPIEVLKKAGLDMTGPEPINAAMQVFADFLKQFKEALA